MRSPLSNRLESGLTDQNSVGPTDETPLADDVKMRSQKSKEWEKHRQEVISQPGRMAEDLVFAHISPYTLRD